MLLFSWMSVAAQDTYYISAGGNNSNTGLSPSASWKTIPYVQSGKTYLLNRGDTLSFSVGATDNPTPSRKIKISSYGSGNKPVLSLYKKIKPSAWSRHSGQIWKVDISSSNNFTGLNSTNTNIGFLKVNGRIYGRKLNNTGQLSQSWDFYSDNTFLYVYNTQNPSGSRVEASCNVSGIDLSDNMEVSDIAICGAGAHGLSAHERSNVTLSSIDISEIGGSYLSGYGNGTTRYGNGIEFFNNAKNCLIQNCSVKQAYDVAFTMQGTGLFKDVTFRNNKADSNDQSFEAWLGSGSEGFRNCKFINNQCYNAGFGWSHDVRPDKNVGVHLLTYLWQVNNRNAQDLLIEGNTFSQARCGLWYWGIWDAAPPAVSKNNIVTLGADVPIRSQIAVYTVKNYRAFVQTTGLEVGTIFNASKTDQTINFSSLASKIFPASAFSLLATSSSGLPVSFRVKSGPATLLGVLLMLTGTGTVVIEASQSGNDYYNAAPVITQQFTVTGLPASEAGRPGATLLMEQWFNVPGTDLSTIPLTQTPSVSKQISSFEAPSNTADQYATRIRGYITPVQSGNYTFWISGDDKAALWLSTDENPSNKTRIAYTDQWTNEIEYNKYPSQKSGKIQLTAGQKYYVEALHKEGPGGDNLSVQWQLPDGKIQAPVTGNVLSPFMPAASEVSGSILFERWMNVSGTSISEIPISKKPSASILLSAFEAPSNAGNNYGARISGYISPPVSGTYRFWISGDDKAELWLSSDENQAGKVKIAYTDEWTNVREYNKFSSQKSVGIWLSQGKKYYAEALMKQGPGGDNLSVQWQLPDGSIQTPLPGKYLSPAQTSNLRIGSSDLSTISEVEDQTKSQETALKAELSVFPNPVTEASRIVFTLPQDAQVVIAVYNSAGQQISRLFDGLTKAGVCVQLPLPASQLSQGTYYIRLFGGNYNMSKKIVIIK
jgi:hypothetical protein